MPISKSQCGIRYSDQLIGCAYSNFVSHKSGLGKRRSRPIELKTLIALSAEAYLMGSTATSASAATPKSAKLAPSAGVKVE